MTHLLKRYHPPGTAPGTLKAVPVNEATPLNIRLIDYRKDEINTLNGIDAAACAPYLGNDNITWVHVEGHPSEAVMLELGKLFKLHPLALEDVLNSGQRPKIEPFDDQLFVVMSMPMIAKEQVKVHQVSFFLSEKFLISFCEGDSPVFNEVIKRLRNDGSRLRSRGSDFLLYSLLDVVIDHGFPVLENLGLQLEAIEEQVLTAPDESSLETIHTVKRELIMLRHMLWPQREVINKLLRDDHALIHDDTLIYLRDCYDHSIHVLELLELYRDMTSSILEIYLSSISNRMNEVMKVLTIIATIFIPLTFIVGVYGMNFDTAAGAWNMPELNWAYGYVAIWSVMLVIVILMVIFFRRRKWF
ncbi:MAG: magnesium transporter [Arenicella sp.]|jgi:magnesium transporter